MPRLSISLAAEQADWITSKSEELDISKGKVVRECIDQSRTGESLFTGPVKSDESTDDERISAVEARLAALEEQVQSESRSAGSDETPPREVQDEDSPTTGSQGSTHPALDADQPAPPGETSASSPHPDQQNSEQAPEAPRHPTPDENGGASSEALPSTDATAPDDGPRMPDASDDAAPESTDQSATDEFDLPALDTTDADEIRSALEASLASDAHATAMVNCWQRIQDRGTARSSSLKSGFEHYPLGHDSADEWWAEEIKPVLDTLPGIDPPQGSGSFYRFRY